MDRGISLIASVCLLEGDVSITIFFFVDKLRTPSMPSRKIDCRTIRACYLHKVYISWSTPNI